MEIIGKFVQTIDEVRGETQRGPWVRGGFVIETGDEYPRKVAFTCFGEERIGMYKSLQPGQVVHVYFNPESREYQGRWFTDLRCSRVEPYVAGQMPPAPPQAQGYAWAGAPANGIGAAAVPPQPAQPAPAAPSAPGFASMPSSEDSDLPF